MSEIERELASIVDRPRGADLLRALAQLAEENAAAFDALVPTVLPMILGAAGDGEALWGAA